MKVIIGQVDSAITSQFGSPILEEGIQAQAYPDGEAMLADLNADSPPDLIILDLGLTNPTAVDLCRLLKLNPVSNSSPILAIETKRNGNHSFSSLMEAGCDDILPFPVHPISLVTRIKSLLRIRSLIGRLDDSESVLATLARTIEAKDKYTMGHADRVAYFAVELGKVMGVKGYDLEILRKGGMLHDIGKIAIPDAILLKPGRYTPEEFAIMKKHPVLGCEICGHLRSVRDALPLVRHHHERLDGSGYPDRLSGGEISPLVRIVSIVDIYDALRSKRSYKEAFNLDKSFQIMWEEAEKGWWDKDILRSWENFVRGQKTVVAPPVS